MADPEREHAKAAHKAAVLFEQTMPNGVTRMLLMSNSIDYAAVGAPRFGSRGAELTFVVKKEGEAVAWRFHPNWYLKSLIRKWGERYKPDPADGLGSIDYHSSVPQYEGQDMREHCKFTGGKCFSDGSALASGEFFQTWLADPAALWPMLEGRLDELIKRTAEAKADERNFS